MDNTIIYVDDFVGERSRLENTMSNISMHCHSSAEDIEIYSRDYPIYLLENDITFPNVIYIEQLNISYEDPNIGKVFPDLVSVGFFTPNIYMKDIGNIQEIDYFHYLNHFLEVKGYNHTTHEVKLWCEDLGDGLFKFISNEATCVVKINEYD